MKARVIHVLETLLVWTVGPVVLFFSAKARKFRMATFITAGGIAIGWWTGFVVWLLGFVIGQIPMGWLGGDLNHHEYEVLERTLTETVDTDSPTYEHTMRLERRAAAFAERERLPPGALRAAALLHDATLEHPRIPVEARFCLHGHSGTVNALRVLAQLENRSRWFVFAVSDSVLRHVGPTGYNWEWQDKRAVSKRCREGMPGPVSHLSKALYDLDMLDRMDVPHAVRAAGEKLNAPGKDRKTLQEILRTHPDGVLKELTDAAQTLQTRTGKTCGKALRGHTTQFIKGLDYKRVTDMRTLHQAAEEYLARRSTPPCLERPAEAQNEDTTDPAEGL
jgi:hypothetical protein